MTRKANLDSWISEKPNPAGYYEAKVWMGTKANGKIDRTALPTPGHTRADLADTFRPPRTSTQRLIADIWCDLLDLDQVGIGDDFFELGGHSLLATRMMNRIRAVSGVELALAAIFDQPTVERIAAAIDAARSDIAGSDTELDEFEF